MKAIVTGGAGFIGSHLAAALLQKGWKVVVLDNLITGKQDAVPGDAQLVQLDIRSEEAKELVVATKADVVFHLAAQTDVQHSLQQPHHDAVVNIGGTVRLLEGCREAGSKLVFASTSAVYGNLERPLLTEQDPVHPISYYGLSKLAAELYIQLFHRLYGVPFTILRFSNVYGPGQTAKGEGGVVAVFLERLAAGRPVTIHGDGGQTRDFIYVGDVVSALVSAASRGEGELLHVSSAIGSSVNYLAELIGDIHGEPLAHVHAPARMGDIRHSRLDNRRARDVLRWQPMVDLRAGLGAAYASVFHQR